MNEQLNAIKLAAAIRERLADFTVSDMFVRDVELSQNMRNVWAGKGDTGGLVSDLWVEGAFPSVPSKDTLNSLLAEGVVCKKLRDLLSKNKEFPSDRNLYQHQMESLREANRGYAQKHNKPVIVVTAGTGSGKTESFLLPMLNDLFIHPPESGGGVSAIILYPMNALVNDQVDRLYKWLKGQPEVTLFNFTSETPEDKGAADKAGVDYWDICRIRTRQEARMIEERYEEDNGIPVRQGKRSHVPCILVTNYSMLEYMLCRPQDNVFFGKNLRTLVLDEAHLYTGVLAAEITLLQRRLLIRCGLKSSDVVQFATSATLGDPDDLKPFAAKLFSKNEQNVKVIVGKQQKPELPPVEDDEPPTIAEICLEKWPVEGTNKLKTLDRYLIIHRLINKLWEKKRIRLTELAEFLFSNNEKAEEATRVLLGLCALAKESDDSPPLLANRIHFLFRGAQGFTVFLDSIERVNSFAWNGWRVVPGYFECCPETGAYGLSLARCSECGEVFFHAIIDKEKETLTAAPPLPREEDDEERDTPKEIFLAVPKNASNGTSRMELVFNSESGCYSGVGAKGVVLRDVVTCWRCNASIRSFRAFVPSSSLIRNIAAETALGELPPKVEADATWLPARGRRLLAFSDSRSSAAKLGPALARQHNRQIIRSLIVCESPDVEPELLDLLRTQIQENEIKQAGDIIDSVRSRLKRQLNDLENELRQCEAGGSVTEWLKRLNKSDIIPEIFDAEQAGNHNSSEWNQRKWEEHAAFIRNKMLPINFKGELARRPAWPQIALETLGLVEVVYPGLEDLPCPDLLLGLLPPELVSFFKHNWSGFVASILDSLRTDGAVTLGNDEEDKQYNADMPYIALGKWFSLDEKYGSWLFALKGTDNNRHRRNYFIQACIKKTVSPEPQTAELTRWIDLVFRHLFQQLTEKAGNDIAWLTVDDRESSEKSVARALRMDFSQLSLRKPITLFRCAITGQVWPRSVAGDAPARVRLELKPVTSDELDKDPRLGRQRREYREAKFFKTGIWGDEHSAQLAPQENRRLQDLFKKGLRNLLSSTTTLELGIDIGGLNAVLMANLPPGKANYLQRAGRAGRRADGSSAVIGFARPMAYEQEVFRRFDRFLDSPLRRPTVFLEREQIVIRHWNAFLLGEFYRTLPRGKAGAMTAYGRMGWFCNLKTVPRWDSGVHKPNSAHMIGHQSGLKQFIEFLNNAKTDNTRCSFFNVARNIICSRCEVKGVLDGEISELLEEAAKLFTSATMSWCLEYDAIFNAWEKENNNKNFANKLYYQLNILSRMTVIEVLANQRVLPRYGFPIDLHKLQVASSKGVTDNFKLERKSIQALREYVPGSKIMAGNRAITSRGILKSGIGERALGLNGVLGQCKNGHSFYTITPDLGYCPYCKARPSQFTRRLLLPRSGYQTAVWDEPKYRYEACVVSYSCPIHVQLHKPTRIISDFGYVPRLEAAWFKDGEILAIHDGAKKKGFAICTKCGYAESESKDSGEGRINLPEGFASHWALNNFVQCWNDDSSPVLRNISLAAQQTTELLCLDFSPWLLRFGIPPHDAIMAALSAALKLAGARLLEIDQRELGMIETFPVGDKGEGLGLLLYDDIPGGCGHVRDLLDHGRAWLEETKNLLHGDEHHHKACLHGCIDCILSAFSRDNKIHPDRLGAYEFLDSLLSNSPWQPPQVLITPTITQPLLELTVKASQEARLLKNKLKAAIKTAMPLEKKQYKKLLATLEASQLSEEQIKKELDNFHNRW